MTALKDLTGIVVLTGGDERLAEAGRLAPFYPRLKLVIGGADGLPALPSSAAASSRGLWSWKGAPAARMRARFITPT